VDFNQNYFEIFQLPVSFDLDEDQLAVRYRQLQSTVHPDKFVGATDHEKRLSLQWATQINSAYETLRSPLPRAIYLLALKDVNIEDNPQLDPMFLMEQIELREQLEDIGEQADSEVALKSLDAFKADVDARMAGLQLEFAAHYEAGAGAAEQAVYKLQFINKLRQAADHLEEKLLDY
jgi:molecular chaperone HscB